MTTTPWDADLLRAQDAIRRGWVDPIQVARCIDERRSDQSILSALLERGWLDEAQIQELRNAALHVSSSQAPDPELEAEEVLGVGDAVSGRFVIERVLPPGGFGRVYVCRTRDTGQRVALKTPLRKYVRSKEHLDMFRDEVLRWVGLGVHPNIVLAYGHESYLRLPFIVMELIENGQTLQSVVKEGADWKSALRFGLHISRGLEHAGRTSGLIHRDLKPGNVMLTPDRTAKITDFGLSLVRGAADGAVVGTPPYMPPEQWVCPESVDVRSDVYSFGIILYELAAGRRPFPDHGTIAEYREDHLNRTPPDIRRLRSEIPEPIGRLIHECLEKISKDRPSDFAVLSSRLAELHRRLLGAESESESLPAVPSLVEQLVNESCTHHGLGRYDEALRLAQAAVHADPAHCNAHVALGNAQIELKRVQEGVQSLATAYRLDPDSIPAVVNLARGRFLLGDREQASTSLHQVLLLAKRSGSFHLLDSTSWLFVELETPEQALRVTGWILDSDPKALLTWNMRSILLRRLGRFDEALECADRTVELNPRYAKGWSNRATILAQMGRYPDAVEAADMAISFEPATAGAYAAKALALRELGRASEANVCLRTGLRVLPGHALLLRALESG